MIDVESPRLLEEEVRPAPQEALYYRHASWTRHAHVMERDWCEVSHRDCQVGCAHARKVHDLHPCLEVLVVSVLLCPQQQQLKHCRAQLNAWNVLQARRQVWEA